MAMQSGEKAPNRQVPRTPGPKAARQAFVFASTALAVLALILVPLPASAGTNPVLVFHAIVGQCWYGNAPASVTVTVTWRDAAGHLKSHFTTTSDTSGYYYPSEAVCAAHHVAVLDRIRADTGFNARTFKVRALTVSFNRSTKIVGGQAPPHFTLSIYVWHQNISGYGMPYPSCTTTATANSSGVYAKNVKNLPSDGVNCTGTFNPIGGDRAAVSFGDGAGDSVERDATAPYLLLTLGSPAVSGATMENLHVTIHLRTAAGAPRGSAAPHAGPRGLFSGTIRSGSAAKVNVKAGNLVDGNWAGAVGFKVPHLTITWDTGANSVLGRCTPHTLYGLILNYSGGTYVGDGRTDADGYTTPIQPAETIGAGDKVTLICARNSGDRFELVRVLQ